MHLLRAAGGVVVLALAGAGGLRLAWPSLVTVPQSVRLALGFCAGTFILTGFLFFAYLAGWSFQPGLVLGLMLLLAVAGLVAIRRRSPAAVPPATGEWPWLAGLLIGMALALSWGRPVYGYDAISMWALKAKLMFFSRTWPATMFDPYTTPHTEYPPLVPTAQAFIFFWLGEFDDVASRVVFAAWFTAGAVILWWWLRQLRASARPVWLVWWCALPVAMEQVKITYADLPLAVYLLVACGAVVAWLREPGRREWLWLAAIFGGMAFWVKQDALIVVGAGFLGLLILGAAGKVAWQPLIIALGIGTGLAVPWRVFVWVRHLPNDFAVTWAGWLVKSLAIAQALMNYALVEGGFAFFWPVLLVTVLFRWRRLRLETAWLVLVLGGGVGAIFAVYWFSTPNLHDLLATSMERVLLDLFGPALLLVALLWRARFRVLRWQWFVFAAALVLTVVYFRKGIRERGAEEIVGMSLPIFPSAMPWLWSGVGLLTVWKSLPLVRRHGRLAIWRTAQYAVVLATFGLALVAVIEHARSVGELWRRFGGRPLAQQRAIAIAPALRQQIGQALDANPRGAHVGVWPKLSLWRHRFYYETYPELVVDGSATNIIRLVIE